MLNANPIITSLLESKDDQQLNIFRENMNISLNFSYSVFVNGGKLVDPILIDRIQDSEGKTIFNNDKRKCIKVTNNIYCHFIFLFKIC